MKTFKGRVVIKGNICGKSVVTKQGLNILASFQKSALKKASTVICSDQSNKDLYNKELTGKIICLPQTIGSTTGGMVLHTIADMGIAPKALLFSKKIDPLAAAGVILSEVWSNEAIITIDSLGDEFLEYVKDDMDIQIDEDGTVSIL